MLELYHDYELQKLLGITYILRVTLLIWDYWFIYELQ